MPEAKRTHKRRILVVNKLQHGLTFYLIAFGAFSSIITSLSASIVVLYGQDFSRFTLSLILTLTLAVFFFVWACAAMILSNKVFGPIYRLHKELKNWNEGSEVKTIKLRKGDYLTDLIDDFNLLVEKQGNR